MSARRTLRDHQKTLLNSMLERLAASKREVVQREQELAIAVAFAAPEDGLVLDVGLMAYVDEETE